MIENTSIKKLLSSKRYLWESQKGPELSILVESSSVAKLYFCNDTEMKQSFQVHLYSTHRSSLKMVVLQVTGGLILNKDD